MQTSTKKYPNGINLITYIQGQTGSAQGARHVAEILQYSGIDFTILDFEPTELWEYNDHTWEHKIGEKAIYNINLFHVNPPELPIVLAHVGYEILQDRYNIAFCLWELERLPESWILPLDIFDEIWTPSDFTGISFRADTNKPVYTMPYALTTPPCKPNIGREHFMLPTDKVLFLCMYDCLSTIGRKNPLGVIEAYKKAFSPKDANIGLVVKLNNATQEDLNTIQKHFDKLWNVYIISEILHKEEINSLIKCADVYVSLHRSEGFGLVCAEAMLLGTPVIATNWSSNTEFMGEDAACMVDYSLVTIEEQTGPYPAGYRWAEPDLSQASEYMRELYENKEFRIVLAERAKDYAGEKLSPDIIAKKYKNRISEICKGCDSNRMNAKDNDINKHNPLPPVHLMERVAGTADKDWFIESGKRTVDEWALMLSVIGKTFNDFNTIVDFGCGCGRALRHLVARLNPRQTLYGLDVDEEAIAWVNSNLSNVQGYKIDNIPPIINISNSSVDLVLCHSVFTHLPEDIQFLWLDELARICSPNAILLLSFHGENVYQHRDDIIARINDYGFAYISLRSEAEEALPEYYGAAFHSIQYIRRHWTKNFGIRAWVPKHALDYQDVVLLERFNDNLQNNTNPALSDNTSDNPNISSIYHSINQASHAASPYFDVPLVTHRKGVIGKLDLFVKRIIRKAMRFLLIPILERNYSFQTKSTEALTLLTQETDRLLRTINDADLPSPEIKNYVKFAYRYLLNRDPESIDIINNNTKNWMELRNEILQSPEYISKNLMCYDVFTANRQIRDIGFMTFDYEGILESNYRKIIKAGDTVIDIGAHTGRHARVFHEIIGEKGHLYVFEPLPMCYDTLCAVLTGENVYIRNVALSSSGGIATFNYAENYPEESGLKKRLDLDERGVVVKQFTVDVETLDKHISTFAQIDYIKIDTEGAELSILQGAEQTIRDFRPIISIEFGIPGYGAYGVEPADLYDFCRSIKYFIHDIFGNIIPTKEAWEEICGIVMWDYYLVPEEKLKFFWTCIHT